MKRCLALLVILAVCLAATVACATTPKDIFDIEFKFQVFEDGTPTDTFIVGTVMVLLYDHEPAGVFWRQVKIWPLVAKGNQGITVLDPMVYNTQYDTIRMVYVSSDRLSFSLTIGFETVQIKGIRKSKEAPGKKAVWEIRGSSLRIDLRKNTHLIEWRPVERVEVPFKEVR